MNLYKWIEYTLQKATDTCWSSHFRALVNIGIMFPPILEVLEYVFEDGASLEQKGDAKQLLAWLLSFDFAFTSIMMKNILGITNELSSTLQRKNIDIVNAMKLVDIAKEMLDLMRNNGWEQLDKEVSSFCHKHDIIVPRMEDLYKLPGRPRRGVHKVTIRHHYEIQIFKTVIDWMLQELNSRFDEVTTELLSCMACFSPNDSFSSFNKDKLVRLAKFYPSDFSEMDFVYLENELETFCFDMKSSVDFNTLKRVECLAAKLVETKKHVVYPLVYKLIRLVLVLPVSTASVERSFSAMKVVKNRLRNKMGDKWMNDCLVAYIEKEVLQGIDNELIVKRFQKDVTRRGQLPKRF